jgi:hypothetical protein
VNVNLIHPPVTVLDYLVLCLCLGSICFSLCNMGIPPYFTQEVFGKPSIARFE